MLFGTKGDLLKSPKIQSLRNQKSGGTSRGQGGESPDAKKLNLPRRGGVGRNSRKRVRKSEGDRAEWERRGRRGGEKKWII